MVLGFPRSCFLIGAILLVIPLGQAQELRVFPPHWFKGLVHDTLELLVYASDPPHGLPKTRGKSPELLEVKGAENDHYAFMRFKLGNFDRADFGLEWGDYRYRYRIKNKTPYRAQPLGPEDNLYLITPDRFANGDTSNDQLAGFNEELHGRQHPFGRHGGDIAGIRQHLDYLEDLGVTALWISPLLENDEPKESYHGYAITDHYRIDPRFGRLADYQSLSRDAHARGMKMVMDVVYNHFGAQHLLFREPPDSSFFHFHPENLQTNYRAVALMDPHVSQADKERFTRGWFDRHMPDVNQSNPRMAQFLIQQSIWWILEAELDAFRIDTYAYPDQSFMAELARRIKTEFPHFFLFGEIWVHMPEIQSYFDPNNPFNPHSTRLDAVTDFQTKYAIKEALRQEQSWTGGVAKLYYRLAADYLYENPGQLITFIDNHDEARIFGELNGDTARLKVALGLLYSLRGIPCLYYGTEIGLRETENHGRIRQDFPGGWPGDSLNFFVDSGRSPEAAKLHRYVRQLMRWRLDNPELLKGDFLHFIPEREVYAYFRRSEKDTLMVLVNTHPNEKRKVALERFRETWPPGSVAREVLTGEILRGKECVLDPMEIRLYQRQN